MCGPVAHDADGPGGVTGMGNGAVAIRGIFWGETSGTRFDRKVH